MTRMSGGSAPMAMGTHGLVVGTVTVYAVTE